MEFEVEAAFLLFFFFAADKEGRVGCYTRISGPFYSKINRQTFLL